MKLDPCVKETVECGTLLFDGFAFGSISFRGRGDVGDDGFLGFSHHFTELDSLGGLFDLRCAIETGSFARRRRGV